MLSCPPSDAFALGKTLCQAGRPAPVTCVATLRDRAYGTNGPVAGGLSIGVFFAMMPLPLQTIFAALVAVRLRVNIPFASASFLISIFSGSNSSVRPSRYEMFAKCTSAQL